jgi:two-component system, OmpR family, phosphate regulon response regulator PhoB
MSTVSRHGPVPHSSRSLPCKRISLFEDDAILALCLRYNFESAGYEVEWMTTGARAVERIVIDPPALIVLDWMLPGLSGIEILRKIRSRQGHISTPVIMLTARTGREDRERALGAGADAFISKPFSIAELMTVVDRLTRRSHVDLL